MENSGFQFARAFSAKLRIPTGLIHQKVSPPMFFTIRYSYSTTKSVLQCAKDALWIPIIG